MQISNMMMSSGWLFNPLTPGTFGKKCVFWTFWWFLGRISAKLPLIQSKMRLQLNSLTFLPPASHFGALWLGHVQKSKFWDRFWDLLKMRKWSTSWGFLIFDTDTFLFLLFFLLQWLTFYWACLQLKKLSSRQAIFSMDQPGVVAGNFALSFSLNYLRLHLADDSNLGIIGKIFFSCRSWV